MVAAQYSTSHSIYENLYENEIATKFRANMELIGEINVKIHHKKIFKVQVKELNGEENSNNYWAWKNEKGYFSIIHKDLEKVWKQSRDGFYSDMCEGEGKLVEVVVENIGK